MSRRIGYVYPLSSERFLHSTGQPYPAAVSVGCLTKEVGVGIPTQGGADQEKKKPQPPRADATHAATAVTLLPYGEPYKATSGNSPRPSHSCVPVCRVYGFNEGKKKKRNQ